MTTFNKLFVDEIFVKGEILENNNLSAKDLELRAIISSVFGGEPITSRKQKIQRNPPTIFDDVNENWSVGSLWISKDAYICMDNKSQKAVWKLTSTIDDDIASAQTTYSSLKVVDEINALRELVLSLTIKVQEIESLK